MLFEDRRDAGRKLAPLVAELAGLNAAIVLGLPRGGVPVAFEVALASTLPLDILVVRKLRAPWQKELAIGAVASGGVLVTNAEVLRALHISEASLNAAAAEATWELEHLERAYRGSEPPLEIDGHDVILVDDGLATGASMRSAARAVRPRASRVVIAVPVAEASTLRGLESEADQVLCVSVPESFEAVGQFYRNFAPTSTEEVCALLSEARAYRQERSDSA